MTILIAVDERLMYRAPQGSILAKMNNSQITYYRDAIVLL